MAVHEIDWNPPNRMLRNFGYIGLVAFAALVALVHYKIGLFGRIPPDAATTTKYVFGALSLYCGVFAAAAPAALKWLYVLMNVVFFPVGWVMSYVMMGIIFFLIITPVGLFFKLIGRDALRRKFEPAAQTYWIKRTPPATVKRYFRQF